MITLDKSYSMFRVFSDFLIYKYTEVRYLANKSPKVHMFKYIFA